MKNNSKKEKSLVGKKDRISSSKKIDTSVKINESKIQVQSTTLNKTFRSPLNSTKLSRLQTSKNSPKNNESRDFTLNNFLCGKSGLNENSIDTRKIGSNPKLIDLIKTKQPSIIFNLKEKYKSNISFSKTKSDNLKKDKSKDNYNSSSSINLIQNTNQPTEQSRLNTEAYNQESKTPIIFQNYKYSNDMKVSLKKTESKDKKGSLNLILQKYYKINPENFEKKNLKYQEIQKFSLEKIDKNKLKAYSNKISPERSLGFTGKHKYSKQTSKQGSANNTFIATENNKETKSEYIQTEVEKKPVKQHKKSIDFTNVSNIKLYDNFLNYLKPQKIIYHKPNFSQSKSSIKQDISNINYNLNTESQNMVKKPSASNSKCPSRLEEKIDSSRKNNLNLNIDKVNNNNKLFEMKQEKVYRPIKTSNNSPRSLENRFKKANFRFNRESIDHEKKSNNFDSIRKKISFKLNLNNLNSHNSDNKSIDNMLNTSKCERQSTIREGKYYKMESEKISLYIKKYFSKYTDYPRTNLKFYKFGRVLGQGAFGKVNLGLHILSGRIVAIKSFNKSNFKSNKAKLKIIDESNLMKSLRHNSIARIYEIFEDKNYMMIVMEYVCGGDLLSLLKKRNKFSETNSKFIFRQIIEALNYCHSQGVIHRDIKLDNILIDISNNIKICDFGISKLVKKGEKMYDQCGTPAYTAPEILRNTGYEGYAADIWSAGVVLYAILSGTFPFRENNIEELNQMILKGKYEKIPEVSEEVQDLVRGIIEVDPKKRLTIEQILNHPWMAGNDNGKFKSKISIFTNAEKIILSKTNIDYKNAVKDDIHENFTLRNLETKRNIGNQDINTKSIILAPFNSSNEPSEDDQSNIFIENKGIKFVGKAKELNRNYEMNFNCETDNGMVINPIENKNSYHLSPISSPKRDNFSVPVSPPEMSNNLKRMNMISDLPSPDSHRNSKKNSSSGITTANTFIIDENLIKIVEESGFKKEFLMKSLYSNELNYATTYYYLLLNDKLE